MSEIVDYINRGLALRYKIRLEHSSVNGICAGCGQTYPCITIDSLNAGPPLEASAYKPKKDTKKVGK